MPFAHRETRENREKSRKIAKIVSVRSLTLAHREKNTVGLALGRAKERARDCRSCVRNFFHANHVFSLSQNVFFFAKIERWKFAPGNSRFFEILFREKRKDTEARGPTRGSGRGWSGGSKIFFLEKNVSCLESTQGCIVILIEYQLKFYGGYKSEKLVTRFCERP